MLILYDVSIYREITFFKVQKILVDDKPLTWNNK